MPPVSNLVVRAKQLLKKYAYDSAHDLSHHERVWDVAQEIVQREDLTLNIDALRVACYWHDLVLEPKAESEDRQKHLVETLNYLSKLMKSRGFKVSFRQRVCDAIKNHSYEKMKQLNIEGEVLFDADKLDAINPNRYRKLILAVSSKQISKFKVFMYRQAAKHWLKTMRDRYHFQASRIMHDKKMKQLLADRAIVQTAKDLGIDLNKLAK